MTPALRGGLKSWIFLGGGLLVGQNSVWRRLGVRLEESRRAQSLTRSDFESHRSRSAGSCRPLNVSSQKWLKEALQSLSVVLRAGVQ